MTRTAAILLARLIFAAVFAMAATFKAGLLFAAVHGPGSVLAVGAGAIWRNSEVQT